MTRFQQLTEDKLVSQKFKNGDFDYWLVIETIDFIEATGTLADGNKYGIAIHAVSPQAAGEEKVQASFDCCGVEDNDIKQKDLVQVECLQTYGVSAQIWNDAGNNLGKLISKAKKEAQIIPNLFGFYLDRVLNRIGSTGWDFIKGNLFSK